VLAGVRPNTRGIQTGFGKARQASTKLQWTATIPAGPVEQSFVLELVLSAFLMFVILGVSTGAAEKGITAGIVVGSVIGLEAMFAGPFAELR
jgi:glycerol uptake facilitator-like aquaporin